MLEALRVRIAALANAEVVLAKTSLDRSWQLCQATTRRIVLSVGLHPVREAMLAAAVRGSRFVTVLCGTERELQLHGEELARVVGPGRLVHAREWALDPEAVLFGRRGAALVEELEPGRMLAESPLPPSPRVVEAMANALRDVELRRYPPMMPTALEEAIARRTGVEPEQIVASGQGSVELLQRLLRACTDPGDEVLAFAPTFDRLPNLCAQEGLVAKLMPPGTSPVSERLVYVVTPNGPDGRVTGRGGLESIRHALPPDRVLVIDRAYADLDEPDPIALDAPGPVVVLRTLSKTGSLAGLRGAWAVAPPPIARLLRRFGLPYTMSELTLRASIASLEDEVHRAVSREALERARAAWVATLEALGFDVRPAAGHLLCVRAPEELHSALDELPFEPVPGQEGWFTTAVPSGEEASVLAERLRGSKSG